MALFFWYKRIQIKRDFKMQKIVLLRAFVFRSLQIKMSGWRRDVNSPWKCGVCAGALVLGGVWGYRRCNQNDNRRPADPIYHRKTFILSSDRTDYRAGGSSDRQNRSGDGQRPWCWHRSADWYDPLFRYFYSALLSAADVTLAWNITATSINAVLSVIVASAVYLALRPALRKAHLAI